jgi:hypothetical protein
MSERRPTFHHRLALLLAATFAGTWLGAVGLTLASARLSAATTGWVLAVFPPGLDSAAISARIVDAEGFPVEPLGRSFAWTAYSPTEGFVGRLEQQGAVLVIRPLGNLRFAGICGAGTELLSPRR